MACELLIANFNKAIWEVGDIIAMKDVPCTWGTKEGPPNFLVVQVTDADWQNYNNVLNAPWRKKFKVTVEGMTVDTVTVRIVIDPSVVSVSGLNSDVPADLQTYVLSLGGTVDQSGTDFLVVTVPRHLDLQQVRRDFEDMFGTKRGHLRRIDPAWVASVINGPKPVLTKLQLLARIKNRLDD